MNAIVSGLVTLQRIFDKIVQSLSAIASAWIFVIMILVTLDIIMRFAFGGPISGVTEIVEISIVVVLFMQMTHALKVGRITRSDALFSTILRHAPRIGHAMGVIFNLAGVGLMLVIVKQGWTKWIQAYENNYYVGNVGVFTFPEWPQRLILVIGCTAMAIQFLFLAIDNFRGMAGNSPLQDKEAVDVESEPTDRSTSS